MVVEGLSVYAQDDVPRIEYFGVTPEQAEYALKAAPKLTDYEVELLPIDTPEEALATAVEHASHLQAVRNAEAKAIGAVAIFSTCNDLSPEDFAVQLHHERNIRLFMKVRLPRDASIYELFREYYETYMGPENDSQ